MRWLSTALGVGLALVVAAWVVFDRRVAHRWPTARAALRPAAWPSWIAGMIWVLSEAFADLSGVELWEGARLVAMSSGAVLALMVIAVPSRFRAAAALGLALLLTALVVADLAYIDFFGSLVPLAALAAMHHLMDASGTVVALLRPAFAWLLVLPATGVLLVWLGRADTDCVPLRVLRMSHWGVVVVAALLSIPALTAVGTATFGELGRRVFSEAHNAGRLGVVGAHLFQIGRGLRSLAGPGALGETDANRVRTFFHQRAEQPAGGPHFGAAQGMNAVLIQVEALQGWVIGARVEGQEITPFLNRATADAAYFSRIYDQTAQGRTSDAEYLVLASGHPLAEGALCFLRQDNGFVTVAHALRQRGYATLSAHPYRRGFWNRAALHPRYGFEQSIFRKELGPGPVVGWGLADGPFLQRTAERLTTLPRPFFAFLITLSLHHPYDAFPVAMRELDLGALENTRVGNYLHAMHHFDGALEAFFGALEQRGLGDETLVMIYGDHVAGLGEPPEVLELAGLPRWDPSVPTRLRTIPAFAWVPRASLGGRIERVGGHVDLGATLLHLLGVRAPPSFVGRVLVEPGPGFAPLPEGSGVGDDRMLVRDGAGPIAGQCFDLPAGTLRPRADCDALAQEVDQELELSRMVLDYDLYDAL
jgi:phosphoglycerol transferase MdoB-like AlkP superfamily enzyme